MYVEFGTLAQRSQDWDISTDTIKFIHPCSIPLGRNVAYIRIVVDICTNKKVQEYGTLTIAGGKSNYQGKGTAWIADFTTAKLHYKTQSLPPMQNS